MEGQGMSKQLQSTLMLFLIAAGFAIFSIVSLIHAKHGDDVVQALLYMIPAIVAFVALLRLPSKPGR
jgi:hypothetical protein